MNHKGNIFVFGDNVNTDEIIPARYLNIADTAELAQYCMEDIRPGFARRKDIRGSILVAGHNFGCGSSREHAPLAIKAAGVSCVLARSFARIFLRNAINIGLPIVELKETAGFTEGDTVKVDLDRGSIVNLTRGQTVSFEPYPEFMRQIIAMGGWLEYARRHTNSNAVEYVREIAQFPYNIKNITF